MADLYELILSVDLPPGLSDAETSDLHWHLGLGPEPAGPVIVTDFAEPVIGDDGLPTGEQEGEPYPLLASRGPAWRVGGVLLSAMEPRQDGGWALTSRQEIHPDDFHRLGVLLAWLRARATGFHCHLRFSEDDACHPLTVADGRARWP